MKARIFTRVLGVILSATLILTVPVFAYDFHYRGGHIDHDYSSGGHVDHDYNQAWSGNHSYAYRSYGAPGHARPPYYGDRHDYGGDRHASGFLGYWGKDAQRHYRRDHHHHH